MTYPSRVILSPNFILISSLSRASLISACERCLLVFTIKSRSKLNSARITLISFIFCSTISIRASLDFASFKFLVFSFSQLEIAHCLGSACNQVNFYAMINRLAGLQQHVDNLQGHDLQEM